MVETEKELGARTRRLVRASDRAALATALREDGWPYASLVMMACDYAGAPLLLLSDLAEHSRNIVLDARVSVLCQATAGLENPLTGLRATLLGRLEKCADKALLGRYVRRHPDAAQYAGFGDFNLYRMSVDRVHVVAGFGVIRWLDGSTVVDPATATATTGLAEAESDVLEHMNRDHAATVGLYATGLLGLSGAGWLLTGIDPEGCDLRCGGGTARLDFDQPVTDAKTAREMLVGLAAEARRKGPKG